MEKEARFSVQGMHCVSCADVIKKALQKKEGILSSEVQYAAERASILYDPKKISEEEIKKEIERAGYSVGGKKGERIALPMELTVSLLLSIPFLFSMLFHEMLPGKLQLLLATIVQFWAGRGFYKASFHAILARASNMDLLIALGTTAAYFYSLFSLFRGEGHLYFESSVFIITLVLVGRYLEERSKKETGRALERLLKLGPSEALVKRGNEYVYLQVHAIKRGDLVKVRPGEMLPVDGKVVEGESAVNEAMITGESLPDLKGVGAFVFAGTNNLNGFLIVEAESVGEETVAKRMAKIVERAQETRAPIQSFADKIAEWFVPAVLALSFLTFLLWLLFGKSVESSLIPAIAVLVIACPCALGLATPTVVIVASGKAAEMGILFRKARAIEESSAIKRLLLDKTGTLTEGKPVVLAIHPEGISKEEALSIAASLAHHSTHPLSKAIVEEAARRGVAIEPIQHFVSVSGMGVRAIKRGKEYFLGSRSFANQFGIEAEEEGSQQIVFLFDQERALALFTITDPLRGSSKEAVKEIEALGIEVVMVTGDRKEVAERIAKEVGIKEVVSSALPEKKAEIVSHFKQDGQLVGMVGDGMNDAPALAAADVSFAIGTGSDLAIETADVTLIKGDLIAVRRAIDLSKRSLRAIKQNLFFAFIYNILAIPLAAFGFLSPIIAAFAMALSSLSVIFNALRLKRERWR